jgi:uncharacterized protein
MLNYKSIPFEVKAAEANADGTGWEIAGLASTWWGEPDAYNDVVQPGAFAESIAERPTKFLFEHHTPIGKQLEIRETDEGLYGRWSVVGTTAGTDAYKLAKAGVLDALSIGYIPLEWEIRADGVRVLQKCQLFEVSAVSIPANENAVITDVKADVSRQKAPPPAEKQPRLNIGDELRRRRLARHGITLEASSS